MDTFLKPLFMILRKQGGIEFLLGFTRKKENRWAVCRADCSREQKCLRRLPTLWCA